MATEEEIKKELDHMVWLKKNRAEKLSDLRKEFPDVPAEQIIQKYAKLNNDHLSKTAPHKK